MSLRSSSLLRGFGFVIALAACGTRSGLIDSLDGTNGSAGSAGSTSGSSGSAGVSGDAGAAGSAGVSGSSGSAGVAGDAGAMGSAGAPACYGQTCNGACCDGAPFCQYVPGSEKPICTNTCVGNPGDCPLGSCCSFQGSVGFCTPEYFGTCGVGGTAGAAGSAGSAGGPGGGGIGPGGTAGAAGSTACGDCVFNVAFGGSSCPAESQNCLNNPGCTELLKCAYDTGCLSSSTPIQCAIQVGCGGDDPQSAQLARQVLDCAVCNAGCGSVCPPPPNGCGTGGAAGSAGSAGSAGAGGFATCDDCVADPSTSDFCQGPLNDCLNDMQCNGLINCLNACTDQACYNECAMQFAGGLDLYNGAVQCFYCTQCSSLCSAEYPGVCN